MREKTSVPTTSRQTETCASYGASHNVVHRALRFRRKFLFNTEITHERPTRSRESSRPQGLSLERLVDPHATECFCRRPPARSRSVVRLLPLSDRALAIATNT